MNKVYSWSPGFETFLFREERLGIARCRETRAAQGGMLYAIQHVRLEAQFGLGVRVRDVPMYPCPAWSSLAARDVFQALRCKHNSVPREGIAEAIDEGPGLFGERGLRWFV